MHLVSAEYGNQRDKHMNIHARDVIVLKTLWNWSYWLQIMRHTDSNDSNCKRATLIMMITYS